MKINLLIQQLLIGGVKLWWRKKQRVFLSHQISFCSCSRLSSPPPPSCDPSSWCATNRGYSLSCQRVWGWVLLGVSNFSLSLLCDKWNFESLFVACFQIFCFFFKLLFSFLNITASAVQISLNESLETCYFFQCPENHTSRTETSQYVKCCCKFNTIFRSQPKSP